MATVMMTCVLLVSILITLSYTQSQRRPTASTTLGSLRGITLQSPHGRSFNAFFGVPYAEPPLGMLRFQAPLPAKPWNYVRDASIEGAVCPHLDPFNDNKYVGKEDCLFVNVYSPPGLSESVLLPVMVFFHGGAFLWGSGSPKYYGAHYLMDHDVVLVTLNNRLGPLGFLSTGDTVAPGNYGLKDQVMALRWIKENIVGFGGNPNKVTIVGHVAGAAAVHYHMLSPLSQGLFHGAISMSGSALSPLAYSVNPYEQAIKLATLLRCPWHNSQAMMSCLRNVTTEEIIGQYGQFTEWYTAPFNTFLPTAEMPEVAESFLPDTPFRMMRKNNASAVPWLIGNTQKDGFLEVIGLINDTDLLGQLDKQIQRILPKVLYYADRTADIDSVTRRIKREYFGKDKISQATLEQLTDLYSHRLFDYPTFQAARNHAAKGNNVYMYRLSYHGKHTFVKTFWDADVNEGATLHDDMLYLYSMEALIPNFQVATQDPIMIEMMTAMWANFATYGEPTPANQTWSVQWTPMDRGCMKYMNLDIALGMRSDFPHQKMNFWKNLPLIDNGGYASVLCKPPKGLEEDKKTKEDSPVIYINPIDSKETRNARRVRWS